MSEVPTQLSQPEAGVKRWPFVVTDEAQEKEKKSRLDGIVGLDQV